MIKMNLKFMHTALFMKKYDQNYDPKSIYEISFDKVIKINSNRYFFLDL